MKRLSDIPLVCMLSAVALLVGCEKIEDYATEARPIVTAYLAPQQEIEIQVMREIVFSDADTTDAINGLTIRIDDGESIIDAVQLGEGTYTAGKRLAQPGRIYTIEFEFNGKVVSATTQIPGKPESFTSSSLEYTVQPFNRTPGGPPPTFPDPIELNWNNPTGDYFLVLVQNIEENPEPINTASSTDRPPFVFRNDPTQSSSYQLRPQQFQYYGKHSIILYHITPDYAALYQNNGSSSLNIKTPYTNVTNGLGIFTSVNADTLELQVIKP